MFLSPFFSGSGSKIPVPVEGGGTLHGQQPGDGKNCKAIGSVTGWKELSARSQEMEEVEKHRQQQQFD